MDFQIAPINIYWTPDRKGFTAENNGLLFVSAGGQVFEPLLTIYGFKDGMPQGLVGLPIVEVPQAKPEAPEIEMPRRPKFIFPNLLMGDSDADS